MWLNESSGDIDRHMLKKILLWTECVVNADFTSSYVASSAEREVTCGKQVQLLHP
jgi:hypothetical protein